MRYFWLCLSTMMLLVSEVSAGAQSAQPPPAAVNFAVVDMDKVVSGYEAFKQANEEFRRYFMEVERQLEMNRRLRLLEDREVQELKDLRAAVVLTPEQKIRLQQLEALSAAREEELAALEQRGASLTPEEQARRETLTAIAAKRAPEVAAEERKLAEARQKRNEEMSAPFNQAIKNALEKVAKQNRVAVIFSKEVVLWASLDLTEAVLGELNRAPQPVKKP